MTQPVVCLAVCDAWPDLFPPDRLYAEALARHGVEVRVAAWNRAGDQAVFCAVDLVVLRATWDWHHAPDGYRSWLGGLAAAGVAVENAPDLVGWNLDKRSILDLEARGVRLPATAASACTAQAVGATMDRLGLSTAVLKPVHGASGFAVERVERGALAGPIDAVREASGGRDLLVQAFLPEIAAGEISLAFFGGAFGHAIRKIPPAGEFRTNSAFRPERLRFSPAAAVVEDAMRVLEASLEAAGADPAHAPLYARIDGVERDGRLILVEVELNEPALGLDLAPESAKLFAAATIRRLPPSG